MRSLFVAVAIIAAAVVLPPSVPLSAQEQPRKTMPVLVKDVKPQYTADAKARKVQGSVEVAAVVKTDGTVGAVRVTKSLDPGLDEEAVKATKQWTFKPGTLDGKPVDVEVNIELTFTIR